MAKTEAEIQNDSKARMKRYRAEMIEKGYVSTTVFLSKEHRAELKRLGDEYRLTRAEAAEHIFKTYLESDNKDVTQTHNINTDQISEIHAAIEALDARLKVLEERDSKQADMIKDHGPGEEITPPVVELTGKPPKRGTPEYSDWLFDRIDPMKRSGMSSIQIERQFNAEGTKPASTKKNKFNRGMADTFYKHRLKKMGLRWDNDLKQPVPIENKS